MKKRKFSNTDLHNHLAISEKICYNITICLLYPSGSILQNAEGDNCDYNFIIPPTAEKRSFNMAIQLYEVPRKHRNFPLRVAKGHFATSHSHLNYYIDFTMSKNRLSEARAGAQLLCNLISSNQIIDTILCLDGTEVMGACMASELTRAGYMNMNAHRTIYVVSPEYTSGSQMIFRDNIAPMIVGKHVLVLAASVSTGYTAKSAIEAIRYYNGLPVGVCSIFACAEECEGFPVLSIYNKNDLPEFENHPPRECPLCKAGVKIDGLVNSHGISCF